MTDAIATTASPFVSTVRHLAASLAVAVCCATGASAQDAVDLAKPAGGAWQTVGRNVVVVTEGGRKLLRFDERAGGGFAWTPALRLRDGDIDVDVRGRDVVQKSFLGVLFHAASENEFEVLWLRPFNFQPADTSRRTHAIQYASYPTFTWQILREQHPGGYEAAVPASIKPDAWVHMHVEIRGTHVKLFLDHATTPALAVESLGGRGDGAIGLWVGDNSPGDFANLTLRAVGAK